MLDRQAEHFPVPAVEFRSVDVASAIYLLDNRTALIDGQQVALDVDDISPPSTLSQPVYSVRATTPTTRRGRARAGESAAVLSIKDVLNADYSADDVLTAIESAVGLIEGAQRAAEIRFHEQTGLLIARGTGEQMAAMHEVIDQLREGIERARHEEDSQQVITRLRSEIKELRGAIQNHEAERHELMQQLTEARTRAELMQQQYQQTQERVHDYERRVAELRQELTEVRNAYSELERRLQRPNPDGNH